MKTYFFFFLFCVGAFIFNPSRDQHTSEIKSEICNESFILCQTVGRFGVELVSYEDYGLFSITKLDNDTIISYGFFSKIIVKPTEIKRKYTRK